MNLCQSIARHYGPKLGRTIDAEREVAITVGATEALFLAFHSFVDPGDEIIMIEPAFDIYRGAAAMCGAVVKYVCVCVSVCDSLLLCVCVRAWLRPSLCV